MVEEIGFDKYRKYITKLHSCVYVYIETTGMAISYLFTIHAKITVSHLKTGVTQTL
jgi:hypothetical protein